MIDHPGSQCYRKGLREEKSRTYLRATSLAACCMSRMEKFCCRNWSITLLYSGWLAVSTRRGWLHTLRRYWSACAIRQNGDGYRTVRTLRWYSSRSCELISLKSLGKNFQTLFSRAPSIVWWERTWKMWGVSLLCFLLLSSSSKCDTDSSKPFFTCDLAKSSYNWTCNRNTRVTKGTLSQKAFGHCFGQSYAKVTETNWCVT